MTAKVIRIVGVSTLIASFGVWVYAFSGAADRDPPDLLDDQAWSESAETICGQALTDVAAMPGALDASGPEDRSIQLRDSTARFAEMVGALTQLETSTSRDTQITTDWLADWGVLLESRLRYADAILDDPAAPFTITDTGVSERLDKRITRFANTNRMPSCITPTDV